jgi:hypothetical protein
MRTIRNFFTFVYFRERILIKPFTIYSLMDPQVDSPHIDRREEKGNPRMHHNQQRIYRALIRVQ